MDWTRTRARFAFLQEAFDGQGGFSPRVAWTIDASNPEKQRPIVSGPCYLVPYVRESADKYAARCAVATYENHLREASERFAGYLGRKRPQREGIDAPLVKLMLDDADLRGTPFDLFMAGVALDCRARGSMLLLIDMPPEVPDSMEQQITQRAVPFLSSIDPRNVCEFEQDARGMFTSVSIDEMHKVDGKQERCVRTWDAQSWRVELRGAVIKDEFGELMQGEHPFGRCPVIPVTESGRVFPVIGKYAQIADLSRRLFNARSERDEILRSQTFSLLTLQIPPEQASMWDPAKATATIGTSSMLVHTGEQPGFIAPDSGPATVYAAVIDELGSAIKRIGMDTSSDQPSQVESGVSRKLRFEALNADLASFAQSMQSAERQIWDLFHRALGTTNRVDPVWPSDFNLLDTAAELDILAGMQAGGFPELILAEKRRAIVAAEFDTSGDDIKAEMEQALNEQAQAPAPTPTPRLVA